MALPLVALIVMLPTLAIVLLETVKVVVPELVRLRLPVPVMLPENVNVAPPALRVVPALLTDKAPLTDSGLDALG